MPSYLQIDNISKSYGPKVLFENIAFNINEGDKIALIAPNGTGKTSLLRILAGKDKSDSGGTIKFLRQIRIAFLEQEYTYSEDETVGRTIRRHFEGLSEEEIEEYERRIVRFLTDFGIGPERRMGELSGGEVKRVALTEVLAQNAEFLILDEPTNHLDLDAIEYLEGVLKRSRCTLFMVTHDRYFLDRVCNTVMEMDRGAIYIYRGDYENYLEKRDERIANYNAETDKVRNVLRRELEWIHATPCARSGKAKYRKQAFLELKDRAAQVYTRKDVSLDEMRYSTRLGNKVIDCEDASFYYGNNCYLKDFTYKFQRGERVGIVGPNGAGKSTFLNLISGTLEPGSGSIERSSTLNIGYYRQEGMSFKEDETVLDIIPDTHLLGKFLFPHDMFSTRVDKLSGGERRRLYLLTILLKQPNVLILDEPTNDLDIVTLNILEEYLLDFGGTLVVVTHDRHFLDRLADHLLVFCGDGKVKDFLGGYSEYRTYLGDMQAQKRTDQRQAESSSRSVQAPKERARKLTFKEQKEMEALEGRISELEEEKSALEAALSGGETDFKKIQEASERFRSLKEELDEAEMRWLELSMIC